MAFNVCFYKYTKRPNSTATAPYPPGNWGGVWNEYNNITLKDRCSIQNPVIVLHLATGASNPVEYNYCYIPEFGRYYFVEDWVNDAYNWEAHLQVDTLATYKDAIGSSTQYILRSSHSSDGSIIDQVYPATGSVNTIVNTAASPFDQVMPTGGVGCYVIGIMNNDQGYPAARIGATCYYVLTPAAMHELMNWLMDPGSLTGFVSGDSNLTTSVFKSLYDPMQYMVSCMFCPITPAKGTQVTSLGYWPYSHTMNNVNIWYLNTGGVPAATGSVAIPKHPQASTRGTYLNMQPFTRYQIEIRPFGWIPLEPADLQGYSTLYYWIYFDAVSGNATLQLATNSNRTNMVYEQTAMLGVPANLAQTSRDYIGSAMSVIGAIGGVAAGVGMGNVPGAIMSGVSGIGNAATNLLPQVQTQGANGSFSELILGRIALVGRFMLIVDEDNADRGRPLCKKATISSYPGYLVCADPDISIRTATRAEMDSIRSYLSNGFFYE